MYANVPGRGRVKTKAYKNWRGMAGLLILQQGRPIEPYGAFELGIAMRKPSANSDLDNRVKAVADALQESRVIEDDKHCTKLTVWWADDLPESVECRVWVYPERVAG